MKPRRNATAWAAAVVAILAVILGIAALKPFSGASGRSLPPLSDGERFVFVPSGDSPQVTVIDGKSNRVVTTLEVAGTPRQVLVSDAAGTMAVSFAGQSALQLVDLAEPAKALRLDLTLIPEVMVASPDGYLVAAADSTRGSIAVVSLHQRKLLFELSGFKDPRNLTFSSDGSQLYVTDRRAQELALVDLVQQSVLQRMPLAQQGMPDAGASALTRTPDGRHGFVSLAHGAAVLVVDLNTFKPVKRLPVGRSPSRPYGTADGRLMLVPNDGDRTVSIIDTKTLEVSATLPGAGDVAAINTGWFESLAFVTSRSEKRVTVLDLMGFKQLADIELPGTPGAGIVNSSGQKLFVSLADTDQLAVIDTQRHALASVIGGAGRRPSGAVMARSNNYCH